MSAALIGSGVGLGLGASYMAAGLGQAVADHARAARIAQAAGGAFSETMLQREMDRLDPAALRVARAHDQLADDPAAPPAAGTWPSASDAHRASAVEGARQLDCLTQAVYFEARGETPRGQAAVAQVVLNRVKNPSFPKTVCGVVFQGAATHGCQFSFACDGSMRHGLETGAWDRARRIAERALTGRVLADIGNATYFHATTVQPAWAPQMLRVAQVGLHVFYRFNPHAVLNRPAEDDRAVFVSLPLAPGDNVRVATAMLEKAADTTVAAVGLGPAEAKAAVAKPSETPAAAKAAQPAAGAPHAAAASEAATDAASS